MSRALQGCWIGAEVVGLEDLQADAFGSHLRDYDAAHVRPRLLGTVVRAVRRVGKYLLIDLQNGPNPNRWFVVQLHMRASGWLYPDNPAAQDKAAPYPLGQVANYPLSSIPGRFRLSFGDGQQWTYRDQRLWGTIHLYNRLDLSLGAAPHLDAHGPDWINDPEAAWEAFVRYLPSSTRRVKDILLDQGIASGLGNYLASEICHLSRVHPHELWRRLSPPMKSEIAEMARVAIGRALHASDMPHFSVFGRDGDWCLRPDCFGGIVGKKDHPPAPQRSFFCTACQPLREFE